MWNKLFVNICRGDSGHVGNLDKHIYEEESEVFEPWLLMKKIFVNDTDIDWYPIRKQTESPIHTTKVAAKNMFLCND